MSGNLQPIGLFELAFRSFMTYMEDEARQLMKLEPSREAVTVTAKVCGELKRFFHGTRLPTSITNQLTKHLLIKLDSMYIMLSRSFSSDCSEEMLLSLVEVFMHPDVTAIELLPSYFHEFHFSFCYFITSIILQKVCNLHNLKVLNLPGVVTNRCHVSEPVFPCQLKRLTVRGMDYDMLRCIVEFCPELENLSICQGQSSYLDIPLLLQCKNLETLRISRIDDITEDIGLTIIKGLSTDTASDVLAASTLKSFSLRLRHQNTLHLIVDKLPHLTEIELVCESHIDLSSLTQLKNLRSLSLDAFHEETKNEYKKILPVLGKNLQFLELRSHFGLDLVLIGEYCTRLKCLHFNESLQYAIVSCSFRTIPNFKTIECLKITSYRSEYLVAFLIAQCVNIKTLIVNFSPGTVSTIEDVLRRTPPPDSVVILCSNLYESYTHFIESLPSRHPNFRVVKTHYWMRLSSQEKLSDPICCHVF